MPERLGCARKSKVPSVSVSLSSDMSRRQRGSILGSIVGILICGVAGGFAAWMLVTWFGIDGVTGALAAAVIGMVVATALWAGGSWLLRTVGWLR